MQNNHYSPNRFHFIAVKLALISKWEWDLNLKPCMMYTLNLLLKILGFMSNCDIFLIYKRRDKTTLENHQLPSANVLSTHFMTEIKFYETSQQESRFSIKILHPSLHSRSL